MFIFLAILSNISGNLHKKPLISKKNSEKISQRMLQEDSYIVLAFNQSVTYNNNFKKTGTTRESLTYSLKKNGEEITDISAEFTLSETDNLEIHFTGTVDSLNSFFSKNTDSKMEFVKSIDFKNFIWSSVTSMKNMLTGCNSLESINLGDINTAPVTDVGSMFEGCTKLTAIDISKLSTASITDMSYMFAVCGKLSSLDLSNFATGSVTDINSMFFGCYSLETIIIDVDNFITENIEYMNSMFSGCNALKSIDISKFDTSKVKSMNSMFLGCKALTSIDLSSFSTSSVESMSNMFSGCESLSSLNLSSFTTTALTELENMFNNCANLIFLDISNFDLTNAVDSEDQDNDVFTDMFKGVSKLKYLNIKNLQKGNLDFTSTPLNSIEGLIVCQPEENPIFTNDQITNKCCDFDIEIGDCKAESLSTTIITPTTHLVVTSLPKETEIATTNVIKTDEKGETTNIPANIPTTIPGTESTSKTTENPANTIPNTESTSKTTENPDNTIPNTESTSKTTENPANTIPNTESTSKTTENPDNTIPNTESTENPDNTIPNTESTENPANTIPNTESTENPANTIPNTESTENPANTIPNTESTENTIPDAEQTDKTNPPVKTDNANASDQPKILPRFTIESINQEYCADFGELTLLGKISEPINRPIKFNLPLEYPKGVSLNCLLNGNQLECETDRVISNLIYISEFNISEYDEVVLIINEFKSKETIKCQNAYLDKAAEKLLVSIAFRQVSHFKKNDEENSFSFYLITLASEALKKGKELNLRMEVKINGNKIEKNATCILQEDVSPNSGELAQGNFICSVKLSSSEYSNTDFEEINVSYENEEINGVSDLEDTISNPYKTDKAIAEIKAKKANNEEITELANIVDYLEEEVKIAPTFTIDKLFIDECSSSGKFLLEGSFSDDITDPMKFDLIMTYPFTDIKCEFSEALKNEKINMTCKVRTGFQFVETLMFEQRLIKKKNKEMFIIQRKEFDFDNNIKCECYIDAKTKIVKQRQASNLSFLQLSKFIPQQNSLTFFMVLARKTLKDTFKSIIQLTVILRLQNRRSLRNLDETISGVKVDCNLNKDLQSDYAAGYNCSNKDTFSGIPKSMEVETSEIDDIQGFPENANPEKLKNKVDYSILGNLKSVGNLPNADIQDINGDTCITDGQFIVTATLDKNENLESKYSNVEFRFSLPESSGICDLNINNKDVEMICQNQEKFYASEMLVERQAIKDSEGKVLFFIDNKEIPFEDGFRCDISLYSVPTNSSSPSADETQTMEPTEENTTHSRYFKKSNGGLSGGAIAGIAVSVVAVVVVIAVLAILVKKGILFGKKEIVTDNSATNVNINLGKEIS